MLTNRLSCMFFYVIISIYCILPGCKREQIPHKYIETKTSGREDMPNQNSSSFRIISSQDIALLKALNNYICKYSEDPRSLQLIDRDTPLVIDGESCNFTKAVNKVLLLKEKIEKPVVLGCYYHFYRQNNFNKEILFGEDFRYNRTTFLYLIRSFVVSMDIFIRNQEYQQCHRVYAGVTELLKSPTDNGGLTAYIKLAFLEEFYKVLNKNIDILRSFDPVWLESTIKDLLTLLNNTMRLYIEEEKVVVLSYLCNPAEENGLRNNSKYNDISNAFADFSLLNKLNKLKICDLSVTSSSVCEAEREKIMNNILMAYEKCDSLKIIEFETDIIYYDYVKHLSRLKNISDVLKVGSGNSGSLPIRTSSASWDKCNCTTHSHSVDQTPEKQESVKEYLVFC